MKSITRAVSNLKILSKRSTTPRFQKRLPPELWLIVFKTGQLGCRDISRVRLTCHTFAALAKALAFYHFTFRPCDEDPVHRNPKAFHFKALAFWMSEAIAPLVQECTVSTLFGYSPHGAQDLPLEEFFQNITKFRNITSLNFQFVPFDNMALAQIGQLTKLNTINLIDCTVIARNTPAIINAAHVQLRSYMRLMDCRERGQFGWLDIFNPRVLRVLRIAMNEPRAVHLRGVTTTASPAPASDFDCVKEHIMLLLTHFGALEELCIEPFQRGGRGGPSPFTFHVDLPSLRVYDGPIDLLECFLSNGTLTDVTLHPLSKNHELSPDDLQKRHISQCDSVHSLTIHASDISRGLLNKISDCFPHLRNLDLRLAHVDMDVSSISYIIYRH